MNWEEGGAKGSYALRIPTSQYARLLANEGAQINVTKITDRIGPWIRTGPDREKRGMTSGMTSAHLNPAKLDMSRLAGIK